MRKNSLGCRGRMVQCAAGFGACCGNCSWQSVQCGDDCRQTVTVDDRQTDRQTDSGYLVLTHDRRGSPHQSARLPWSHPGRPYIIHPLSSVYAFNQCSDRLFNLHPGKKMTWRLLFPNRSCAFRRWLEDEGDQQNKNWHNFLFMKFTSVATILGLSQIRSGH